MAEMFDDIPEVEIDHAALAKKLGKAVPAVQAAGRAVGQKAVEMFDDIPETEIDVDALKEKLAGANKAGGQAITGVVKATEQVPSLAERAYNAVKSKVHVKSTPKPDDLNTIEAKPGFSFQKDLAEPAVVGALSGTLAPMDRVMAANDAMNRTAGIAPREIDGLGSLIGKVGDISERSKRLAIMGLMHPVDTFNAVKDSYDANLPVTQEAHAQYESEHPKATFVGGLLANMVPGAAAGLITKAPAAASAVAAAPKVAGLLPKVGGFLAAAGKRAVPGAVESALSASVNTGADLEKAATGDMKEFGHLSGDVGTGAVMGGVGSAFPLLTGTVAEGASFMPGTSDAEKERLRMMGGALIGSRAGHWLREGALAVKKEAGAKIGDQLINEKGGDREQAKDFQKRWQFKKDADLAERQKVIQTANVEEKGLLKEKTTAQKAFEKDLAQQAKARGKSVEQQIRDEASAKQERASAEQDLEAARKMAATPLDESELERTAQSQAANESKTAQGDYRATNNDPEAIAALSEKARRGRDNVRGTYLRNVDERLSRHSEGFDPVKQDYVNQLREKLLAEHAAKTQAEVAKQEARLENAGKPKPKPEDVLGADRIAELRKAPDASAEKNDYIRAAAERTGLTPEQVRAAARKANYDKWNEGGADEVATWQKAKGITPDAPVEGNPTRPNRGAPQTRVTEKAPDVADPNWAPPTGLEGLPLGPAPKAPAAMTALEKYLALEKASTGTNDSMPIPDYALPKSNWLTGKAGTELPQDRGWEARINKEGAVHKPFVKAAQTLRSQGLVPAATELVSTPAARYSVARIINAVGNVLPAFNKKYGPMFTDAVMKNEAGAMARLRQIAKDDPEVAAAVKKAAASQ